MRVYKRASPIILALFLALSVFGQQPQNMNVIWEDRGEIPALDLAAGPGGKGHAPGTTLTFIKEYEGGTSPKFEVQDENGTRWKVKLGPEVKSETAATRLIWAAGYFADEDYYLAKIRVRGLPRLHRGQKFVSNGDFVNGARLERDKGSKLGESKEWSWYDNPFVGTREFNGLRVMMALVNNWDLKQVNNSSSDMRGGGQQYRIADLGATLGATGNNFIRTKGVMKDYVETGFIEKVTTTDVDFVMHSRSYFLSIFNFPNYRFRTRMEKVAKHIPIADARWIGNQLGQLSTEQIRACFTAAGFSPAEVDGYTRVVMQRIAQLMEL